MCFIKEDFLLTNETAKRLYHKYAADMPIIDYHCHINPQEIYEDKQFENITRIWLGGDHYKWRLIRSNGVSEDEITGSADDRIKFERFAQMLPRAIGNPMYHWTHLELKRYFGYDGILNGNTAGEVWDICNRRLAESDMTVRSIIKNSNVKLIGTTDDPIDSLEWHKKIAEENGCTAKVVPSFRPDKAVNIDKEGFVDYIKRLSVSADIEINSVDDVKTALTKRLEYFCGLGCCASDHGLDYVPFAIADENELEKIFVAAMNGEKICKFDADKYKTAILLHLGKEYSRLGVVMQIHYGAQRNTNTKMFNSLGPDTGFDCISTINCGEAITAFLNELAKADKLPKTVLYSLNPNDNELLDTILGCFQGTEVAGKIQHGSAWWFSDTKSGMEAQLKSLANLSLLGNFIGMLTDSRSFLSYTRHEYFRRILCNLIGEWVENGEYPDDETTLESLVKDICYNNAARFFGIE
ncbi:MAG: glucuronate isomerase [Clostridia bacterium]|nr:glucuronate isomerase [Clostridia bacterium]